MAAIARNEVIDVELREVMGTRKIPLELFGKNAVAFRVTKTNANGSGDRTND
jgi:hypothetical protein